ncbi:MAG TPA: O-antigen polymerase [Pyrinomonadaceae bacterium]|nr:O-antigen polymerase [Pyrinomonadaceae bacterium]
MGSLFALILLVYDEASVTQIIVSCNAFIYLVICWNRFSSHPKDVLEIDTVYLVFFGIYHILPIAVYSLTGIYGDTRLDRIVAFCFMLSLLGFAAGFYSSLWSKVILIFPRLAGTWRAWEPRLAAGFLIAFGIVLLYLLVTTVGLAIYTEAVYVDVYAAESGKGIFSVGLIFISVGLLTLYIASTSDKKMSWLAIIVFVACVLLSFRMGRRRQVLELGIGLLAIRHFYIKPVRTKVLLIGAIAILPVFVMIGQARAYLSGGIDAMVEYVKYNFSVDELQYVTGEPETVALALRETVWYMEGDEYRYGRTFVEAFEILVPLSINAERPLAPSEWFVRIYDPNVADKGGGYSYALIAEGYLNFGLLGVFAVFFVEGLFLRTLIEYRKRAPDNKGRGLLYAVVLTATISLLRGDFASLLKANIVSAVLPTLIVVLWLSRHPSLYGEALAGTGKLKGFKTTMPRLPGFKRS